MPLAGPKLPFYNTKRELTAISRATGERADLVSRLAWRCAWRPRFLEFYWEGLPDVVCFYDAQQLCDAGKRRIDRIPCVRCSIVASISACHAEDPGSIPGGGDLPSVAPRWPSARM